MVDVCDIQVPGDKLAVHTARVDEDIKRRFPEAYLAYTRGDVAQLNGTALKELPTMTDRLALEMNATGIMTVEDLAGMDETTAKKWPQGITWRRKASEWLANRRPDENAALRSELAELKAMVAELTKKRGPGRPRKEDEGVEEAA